MSEQTGQATIAERAKQATIAEQANKARRHYAKISTEAMVWYSLIPDAIDAWEREQTRLRRSSLLVRLRGFLRQFWLGVRQSDDDGRE